CAGARPHDAGACLLMARRAPASRKCDRGRHPCRTGRAERESALLELERGRDGRDRSDHEVVFVSLIWSRRTQGLITTGFNRVGGIGRVSLLIDHAVWVPAFRRDDNTEKCSHRVISSAITMQLEKLLLRCRPCERIGP